MDVGELVASLRLNLSQFSSGMNQAQQEVKTGMANVARAVESSSGQASKALQNMGSSGSSAAADLGEAIKKGPKQSLTELDNEAKRVTWNVRGYLKDTGRVVTGILIAQGFYKVLSAIEGSIAALFRFDQSLQQSEIAFTKMLGSAQAAKSFMMDLQDLSATTPFSYEAAQKAAQNLLNVGWAADKVIPTLRTVIDAASLRGASPDVIDGIVLALGQIANKGKVSAEELNQLADRGIPAYQILRKELNLSAKAMQNIGKEGIPAEQAIGALLRGIDKFAGGTSQLVAKTTGGLVSSIKDNLLIAGNIALAPMFKLVHSGLTSIDGAITKLRQAGRKGGTGGIFEAIFPPSIRTEIRAIIASIQSISQSVAKVAKAIWPILQTIGGLIIKAFSVVLPVLAAVVRAFANLTAWALQSTPAVRAITLAIVGLLISSFAAAAVTKLFLALRTFALLTWLPTLITAIGTAIKFLLLAITRNPLGAVITALSVALLGLAMTSKQVSGWLDRVTKQLVNLGGLDVNEVLQPELDPEGKLETYTNQLKDTTNNYGDMGDAAQEAAKKAKKANDDFIASFDEVFNMKDPNEGDEGAGGAGGGGGTGGGDTTTGPGGGAKVDTGGTFDPTGGFKMPPVILLPELKWPDSGGPTAVATALELSMNEIREQVRVTEAQTVPASQRVGAAIEGIGVNAGVAAAGVKVGAEGVGASWEDLWKRVLVPVTRDIPVVQTAWNNLWNPLAVPVVIGATAVALRWLTLQTELRAMIPVLTELRTDWNMTMNWLQSELVRVNPVLTTQWALLLATIPKLLPVTQSVRTDWGTTMNWLQSELVRVNPTIALQWGLLTALLPTLLPVTLQVRTDWNVSMNWLQSELARVLVPITADWATLIKELNTLLPVTNVIRADWHLTLDYMQTQLNSYVPYLTFQWLLLDQTLSAMLPTFETITLGFHVMIESMLGDLDLTAPAIVVLIASMLKALTDLKVELPNFSGAWSNAMAGMQKQIGLVTAPILASITAIQQAYASTMAMIGKAVSIPQIRVPEIQLPSLAQTQAAIGSWWDAAMTKITPTYKETDLPLRNSPGIGYVYRTLDSVLDTLKPITEPLAPYVVPGVGQANLAGAAGRGAAAGAAQAVTKLKQLLESLKGTGGVPIPGFERGGIIRKDSIIRAGERNRPEAIIPLANGSAMQPFADAVANSLGRTVSMASGGTVSNQHITLNAGVLIADRAGLKELERVLSTFRQTEGSRGSNT